MNAYQPQVRYGFFFREENTTSDELHVGGTSVKTESEIRTKFMQQGFECTSLLAIYLQFRELPNCPECDGYGKRLCTVIPTKTFTVCHVCSGVGRVTN